MRESQGHQRSTEMAQRVPLDRKRGSCASKMNKHSKKNDNTRCRSPEKGMIYVLRFKSCDNHPYPVLLNKE